MAATPENKVKKMVKAVLAEFSSCSIVKGGLYAGAHVPHMSGAPTYHVTNMYQFWPVPSGMGASSLDCIVCYYGVAIYIETKAPGKLPTPRQDLTIAEIKGAGGLVFVIDSEEGCKALRNTLNLIRFSNANNR